MNSPQFLKLCLHKYIYYYYYPFYFHAHHHLSQLDNQALSQTRTFLPPTLGCPPDGGGIDPSLFVRSVTSAARLGVAFSALGRVHASPRARDCGHVSSCPSSCCETHLICKVNVFSGKRRWAKQASRPIRAEQITGTFLHCKVRLTASGGWMCLCAVVSSVMLGNSFLLWKSCYCFLWLSVSGRHTEKLWPQEWV